VLNTPGTVISVATGVAAFVAAYYSLFVAQRPEVFAGSSKIKKFLDKHVKTLKEKFYPAPLLCEGRLQTMFGSKQRTTSPSKFEYSRELLTLSDGGEVALDYLPVDPASAKQTERPVLVLFLPGLTSSSQSSYVRTLVQALHKAGAAVVVFNTRGSGGVPFKSPKAYSASYIGDLEQVIPYIKHRFPAHRLIGLGTSVGGMVMSKYLVSKPVEAKEAFECAILISIAWDWVRGSDNFEKPFINKYVINKALAGGLIKLGKQFLNNVADMPQNFNSAFDPASAMKAKTVQEFDANFTAPMFEFPNRLEYYKSASTSGNVHKYTIPVFGLSAADDPLQPGNLLPTDEAAADNSKLALIVTSHGGHLGWLEGFTRHSQHYMERLVGELVEAIRIYGTEELSGA